MSLLKTLPLAILLNVWSVVVSAEELQLPDVMGAGYKFASGFQRSVGCDAEVTSRREVIEKSLSRSIGEFKRLSTLEKIREVHKIADAAFLEVEVLGGAEGLPEFVAFLKNPKSLSALTYRLNFLGSSSRKSLNENARELLVIANKLVPFTSFAHSMDSRSRQGIAEFLEKVADLKSDSGDERVDHALRALVMANSMVVVISGLSESTSPSRLLRDTLSLLHQATGEDIKGYQMAAALESSVLSLVHCVASFKVFPAHQSVGVENILVQMIGAITSLLNLVLEQSVESGNFTRFHHYLGMIEELSKQPNLAQMYRVRDKVNELRAQFKRPSDQRVN